MDASGQQFNFSGSNTKGKEAPQPASFVASPDLSLRAEDVKLWLRVHSIYRERDLGLGDEGDECVFGGRTGKAYTLRAITFCESMCTLSAERRFWGEP